MTDKFELDKKFQALPEYVQAYAAEALRNVLSSQGVIEDGQFSAVHLGTSIKKAFIALFEEENSHCSIGDGGN